VIGSCPNLRFTLDGSFVTTDKETKFKKGHCGDVDNGTRLSVKGRRQENGVVDATEVTLEDK
jgi:hypothetical protein